MFTFTDTRLLDKETERQNIQYPMKRKSIRTKQNDDKKSEQKWSPSAKRVHVAKILTKSTCTGKQKIPWAPIATHLLRPHQFGYMLTH